jgi:uncharacterized protein
MRKIITLPGIGGSGDEHWQTLWEAGSKDFARFSPSSWDEPRLEDWVAALDAAVAASDGPPVLLAHSLACLLVAHWQARSALPVAGAMLVAVPDPLGAAFPAEAASFADPPEQRLRFPSVIAASGNDPFGTMDHARRRAGEWGSRLVEMGDVGHINAGSGLGDWPAGRMLLADFMARLPAN